MHQGRDRRDDARGNFIVTYESIIPQLGTLREYKPLMQEFWREGLFDELDERYFRLINRAPELARGVDWTRSATTRRSRRSNIFRADNVGKESYFDSMTHFDFKTLLPALLHVEDRVEHGARPGVARSVRRRRGGRVRGDACRRT